MLLAVAMKEWLTVTTSSPGPTPAARSAKCNAVVQLDTAHAYSAPTQSANSRSKATTSGPCVIHPERITRRAASASRSSIQGFAMGINRSPFVRTNSGSTGQEISARAFAPPLNQPLKPFFERNLRLEAEHLLRFAGIGEPPRNRIYFSSRSVFRRQTHAHHTTQCSRKLIQTGLDSTGDVEDLIGCGTFRGQDVCPRHVLNEDEIHRLGAIAENQTGLSVRQSLHPADQDFCISAVNIHPRAIYIEISQRDIVQPVHLVETPQQSFVKEFCGAVNRPIIVAMMGFLGREVLCQPVNRGGRSCDDFLHASRNGLL